MRALHREERNEVPHKIQNSDHRDTLRKHSVTDSVWCGQTSDSPSPRIATDHHLWDNTRHWIVSGVLRPTGQTCNCAHPSPDERRESRCAIWSATASNIRGITCSTKTVHVEILCTINYRCTHVKRSAARAHDKLHPSGDLTCPTFFVLVLLFASLPVLCLSGTGKLNSLASALPAITAALSVAL